MKRALVTGGSGGIGAAICRRLAASGHHVIVHANRSGEKAATASNTSGMCSITQKCPAPSLSLIHISEPTRPY